ncbi:hypothetical protein HHUSO_G10814 [Huso huso]|uniref:Elongin A n=1 Tax=Huso huso TaxID=61971 RepID=A0ABR0ZQI3_HUSHU
MLKKINAVFRPNHSQKKLDGQAHGGNDKNKACAVRLVRSTSMLIVGETRQKNMESSLKRSRSSVSIESTAVYFYRQEDRIWLYSRTQDCLQYLEDLMALRRQYVNSVNNLKTAGKKADLATDSANASKPKGKPPPPPPPDQHEKVTKAPPVPDEVDTLEYFDSIVASFDSEKKSKAHLDDGHTDVDFVGKSYPNPTSEHDIHSNWMLRSPRRFSMDESKLKKSEKKSRRNTDSARMGNSKRLERNPIHLPKVVESAFQTLRFKPKIKKKNSMFH